MSKASGIAASALATAFLLCFALWPLAQIFARAGVDADGALTVAYFSEALLSPVILEGLWNAFWTACATTALALALALPLAYHADRYDFPGKSALSALLLAPIMLPPFVGAIGLREIFGQYGAFNALLSGIGVLGPDQVVDWLGSGGLWGVVIVNALSLYPVLYLNVLASLSNVDPGMEEAAEQLGCRSARKFFAINLPLIRPGVFAGATLVFVWAFTELGAPLVFGVERIASVQIFRGLKEASSSPYPYALTAIVAMLAMAFYIIGRVLFGRGSHAAMARAGSPRSAQKADRSKCVRLWALFGGVAGLSMLPHVSVALISFSSVWHETILPHGWTLRNYELALGHPLALSSIQNSLIFSGGAVALALMIGICVAYVSERTTLPWRRALDALSMLPLAVPGLALAFGYLAMTRDGAFFDFISPEASPAILLIVAYAARKLPLAVRCAEAGLKTCSATLEEAAQSMGCHPLKAFFIITLPLISASLAAGAILVFAGAMLEVSDSLILAQKQQSYPIAKAIYELLQSLGDGRWVASALGAWAMLFLGVSLFGASLLMGRRMGAIFRA